LCRRARLLAWAGRTVEARRDLERVAHDDFKNLAVDMKYADNLAALAVTCVALGDKDHARKVDRRLRPAGGRNLVFGPALLAPGPALHYRGVLAALLEHYHVAERCFAASLSMSRRMGWAPMAAETKCEYASALLRRGRPKDRAKAQVLLDDSQRTASALGLERLSFTLGLRRADLGS
jgi:hypothetical protein